MKNSVFVSLPRHAERRRPSICVQPAGWPSVRMLSLLTTTLDQPPLREGWKLPEYQPSPLRR